LFSSQHCTDNKGDFASILAAAHFDLQLTLRSVLIIQMKWHLWGASGTGLKASPPGLFSALTRNQTKSVIFRSTSSQN